MRRDASKIMCVYMVVGGMALGMVKVRVGAELGRMPYLRLPH